MKKVLEVGKYYSSLQQLTHESDEVIVLGEFHAVPKRVIVDSYLIPFKVNKIEAVRVEDGEELDLIDDSLLRDSNGNLNHKDYDIEIDIDIALEHYSIDDLIKTFIDLSDEKEIEKFTVDYKKFCDEMNKMSDKYDDMISA